jgi:hypothetical protein
MSEYLVALLSFNFNPVMREPYLYPLVSSFSKLVFLKIIQINTGKRTTIKNKIIDITDCVMFV